MLACVTYRMDKGMLVAGESHRKSEGEFECGSGHEFSLGHAKCHLLVRQAVEMCTHTAMGSFGNPLHLEGVGGCGQLPGGACGAVFTVWVEVEGLGRRRTMRRESQRFGELGEGHVCSTREESMEDSGSWRSGPVLKRG